MEFEWDPPKAAQNLLDVEDSRHDYSEQRWITLGNIDGRIFAVAYTRRGVVIRLISARKANPREQSQYYETLPS